MINQRLYLFLLFYKTFQYYLFLYNTHNINNIFIYFKVEIFKSIIHVYCPPDGYYIITLIKIHKGKSTIKARLYLKFFMFLKKHITKNRNVPLNICVNMCFTSLSLYEHYPWSSIATTSIKCYWSSITTNWCSTT